MARLLAARLGLALLGIVALITTAEPQAVRSKKAAFRVAVILRGLENPWSLAFLPGGGIK